MSKPPRKKWYKPYEHEDASRRMASTRREVWDDMVDDGVFIAQANLGQIASYAQEARAMLEGLEDIPDWAEDKISKARAMIGTILHFLEDFEDVFEDDDVEYDDDEPYDEEDIP